ncbi:MAG: ABC transporter ATP-binding protein [Acidimicrobiales bacterium]|nr:ABC transporter ATP-binding protein [Acidimicrobiales bacterium]
MKVEVNDIRVQFGGVMPLDGVTVTFPGGTCGLIGPNGAGKTTFFNVLSGYVTPVNGSVRCDGVELLTMPDYKRARWGVRRTFQTEQAIEGLSVFDNVLTVYEHTAKGSRAEKKKAVDEALEFCGLLGVRDQLVRTLPAKERRFIEMARAVVGSPKVVLLDEPAAGLPDEETNELSVIIRSIPERSDATVILVDHDMALVQACCEWSAVLDFGRLLASGPTGDVLRDPKVLSAYLGEDEL